MPPGGQKPLRRPDISVPAIKDIWLFRHYLLDLWPGCSRLASRPMIT
jgi:hypothetical protein